MKFIIALCALAMAITVSGMVICKNDEDKWHNEFDRLLMEEIEDKYDELERGLLVLSMNYKELLKTHDKELKEKILRELTISENFLKGSVRYLQRESQRKDLNLFEKYNVDSLLEIAKLLTKELDSLTEKVKNMDTNDD